MSALYVRDSSLRFQHCVLGTASLYFSTVCQEQLLWISALCVRNSLFTFQHCVRDSFFTFQHCMLGTAPLDFSAGFRDSFFRFQHCVRDRSFMIHNCVLGTASLDFRAGFRDRSFEDLTVFVRDRNIQFNTVCQRLVCQRPFRVQVYAFQVLALWVGTATLVFRTMCWRWLFQFQHFLFRLIYTMCA